MRSNPEKSRESATKSQKSSELDPSQTYFYRLVKRSSQCRRPSWKKPWRARGFSGLADWSPRAASFPWYARKKKEDTSRASRAIHYYTRNGLYTRGRTRMHGYALSSLLGLWMGSLPFRSLARSRGQCDISIPITWCVCRVLTSRAGRYIYIV